MKFIKLHFSFLTVFIGFSALFASSPAQLYQFSVHSHHVVCTLFPDLHFPQHKCAWAQLLPEHTLAYKAQT